MVDDYIMMTFSLTWAMNHGKGLYPPHHTQSLSFSRYNGFHLCRENSRTHTYV